MINWNKRSSDGYIWKTRVNKDQRLIVTQFSSSLSDHHLLKKCHVAELEFLDLKKKKKKVCCFTQGGNTKETRNTLFTLFNTRHNGQNQGENPSQYCVALLNQFPFKQKSTARNWP